MPKPIIAGNWKMYTTIEEGKLLASSIMEGLHVVDDVEIVLCPPFVSLAALAEVLEGTAITLGAQNIHEQMEGAYTGEVSALMIKKMCEYVIIGHSERRHMLGETDTIIGKKVTSAVDSGIKPILCVGETQRERQEGKAKLTVEHQLRLGLSGLTIYSGLIVAYEPVWAIGTGKASNPDDAQTIASHIRKTLVNIFDNGAIGVPILYGGSVNSGNVSDFLSQQDVGGALVGSASLDAKGFVDLVHKVSSTR